MDEVTTVNVYAAVNEAGEYAIGLDREGLKAAYETEIGEWEAVGVRVIQIAIAVPTPKRVVLSAAVPEELAVGPLRVA